MRMRFQCVAAAARCRARALAHRTPTAATLSTLGRGARVQVTPTHAVAPLGPTPIAVACTVVTPITHRDSEGFNFFFFTSPFILPPSPAYNRLCRVFSSVIISFLIFPYLTPPLLEKKNIKWPTMNAPPLHSIRTLLPVSNVIFFFT